AINESSDRSVATMDKSLERATKTLDVAREAGEALQLIATAVSEIGQLPVFTEQSSSAKTADYTLRDFMEERLSESMMAVFEQN
ncbi:DUF3802 family protein, partial [Pantoea sp. SIMBA_072]